MPKPASTPLPPPGTPARPGGHSAGAPPDPVPNSAVKPRRAHGTASQDAGERVAAGSGGRPRTGPPRGGGGGGGGHHRRTTPRHEAGGPPAAARGGPARG